MHRIRSLRSLLAVLAIAIAAAISTPSFAQIGISVGIAPPELPVYDQPLCPGDGYLWTPGYWAYDSDYFWVPGTWVLAPEEGFLWTPPYWGWEGGGFLFHEGYWGQTVGFYGGISYGFGYFGIGFEGGRWDGGHFFYNRAVANINVTNIHNVYNTTINRTVINHVSYNGGNGGITARPTPQEEAASRERHIPPVAAQTQHVQSAKAMPELRDSANHGKPPIAATSRPGERAGAMPARDAAGGGNRPEDNRPAGDHNAQPERNDNNAARPATAVHPNDLTPAERAARPNTGDSKLDKKYQKQQDKLYEQQNKDRQKLQQQQDKEHQQMDKQKASDDNKQQLEQRHQQQTQQLTERHTQQTQEMQTRQAPAARPAGRPR